MVLEYVTFIFNFLLHIDKYLDLILLEFGSWAYFILFAIVFLETGFVLTPFLPGDSLLFVAGTFAARGSLNVLLLFFIFCSAAILGDSLNYWVGKHFGTRVFKNIKFFKQEYLTKTEAFYAKHGGKTIIFARFIPVVRTFAPFVAGIGKMDYIRFLGFNVAGGIIWVGLFVFTGYYFGGIPLIADNLALVILAIILLSFVPVLVPMMQNRLSKRRALSSQ